MIRRRLVLVALLLTLALTLPDLLAQGLARPATPPARAFPIELAGSVRPAPAAEAVGVTDSAARGLVREPHRVRPGQERVYTVAIDPGHGGPEPGAVNGDVVEKTLNLQIALKLAELLQDDGMRVVLTRDTDRAVSPEYKNPSVRGQLTLDLQARVDIANEAGADLFLSIHNNGSGDPGTRGTEVWYSAQREFSDRNLALARLLQGSILDQLREAGVGAVDRGIKDDTYFRVRNGVAFNIFVLGPGTGQRPHAPTNMPAALGESLFVSNWADADALRQPETIDAIAGGYRDAVLRYFEAFPD